MPRRRYRTIPPTCGKPDCKICNGPCQGKVTVSVVMVLRSKGATVLLPFDQVGEDGIRRRWKACSCCRKSWLVGAPKESGEDDEEEA